MTAILIALLVVAALLVLGLAGVGLWLIVTGMRRP